jgi:hypothetical protein
MVVNPFLPEKVPQQPFGPRLGLADLGGLHPSGRFEAQFRHRLIPDLELLDLAGDGHRELVGEIDVAGDFVGLSIGVETDRFMSNRVESGA